MNIEVNALRRAVEPLTHMMSGLGLKVSFQGGSALTEFDPDTGMPKRVVLPMIPGDADPDLISAFHGYLDHEVAHCMYTKLSKSMLKECENSTLQTIHNMVEDARIEKLMCRRFRGSAFNFQKLREKVFPSSNFILAEDGNFAEYQRFMQALLYSIRALSGQASIFKSLAKFPSALTLSATILTNVLAIVCAAWKRQKTALSWPKTSSRTWT